MEAIKSSSLSAQFEALSAQMVEVTRILTSRQRGPSKALVVDPLHMDAPEPTGHVVLDGALKALHDSFDEALDEEAARFAKAFPEYAKHALAFARGHVFEEVLHRRDIMEAVAWSGVRQWEVHARERLRIEAALVGAEREKWDRYWDSRARRDAIARVLKRKLSVVLVPF